MNSTLQDLMAIDKKKKIPKTDDSDKAEYISNQENAAKTKLSATSSPSDASASSLNSESTKRSALIRLDFLNNTKIKRLWTMIGVICGLLCGIELHEALYWFSHLKQVEREISLRTEAGFYYSYFKKLIQPKYGFYEGVRSLLYDSRTEYPREINAIQRFNIYPEIFLAFIYRLLTSNSYIAGFLPHSTVFYVYSCFIFSGFGITALFLVAWSLTHSWIFGFLTATWMTVNHLDSSRTFFTVNMRENFALPFFWLQNLVLLQMLKHSTRISKKCAIWYLINTILFILCWQFNQFVLLLQSLALLSVAVVNLEYRLRVANILCLQLIASVLAMILQFLPPFTCTSISVSFAVSAIIVLYLTEGVLKKILSNCIVLNTLLISVTFGLTAAINKFTRFVTAAEADSHIWTFVKAKLGLQDKSPVPFETAIYLCHKAFDWIDNGFFTRTKTTAVLPVYCAGVIVVIILSVNYMFPQQSGKLFHMLSKKTKTVLPTRLVFLVVQSLLFGVLAILTMRMKYLWFPYIVLIAAYSVYFLSKLHHQIPVNFIAAAIAIGLLVQHYPVYKEEIQDEKEFWDPETVDLMEWISKNTPTDSSWAGTMQLMAGVKACTGRRLINHPHFEDKWLRNRTAKIYQIYARQPIHYVHNILRNEAVDFIIVEESTCRAPSSGCSTKDLIDLENGIMPESAGLFQSYASQLRTSTEPRFCDQIYYDDRESQKYFKLAFSNEKFRIYEILAV
uniref:C-mannosyltransferase DPY19L3 n=1 Tax=Syphacia muris TaxID=451379 RepID=A0A0N5AYK3_9BILA